LRSRIRSVVFVVDISGSMVEGQKNEASYGRLESEVEKALRGLEPRTRFGLVAFSAAAETYRMDLVDARADEIGRAMAWLKKQSPVAGYLNPKDEKMKEKHRGTRADLGLDRAFRMKPDTIFFVSDGAPTGVGDDEVFALVEKNQSTQTRRVVVHAVAYLAEGGESFMRELARKNNGEYQEIR
jgi:hypothetical protein